jgi:hypothetical protein
MIERFKKHVMLLDDSDDSCWIWTGALRDDGRGRFKVRGREWRAHRVAWELLHGRSIPKGMRLTQECNHPQCVRHWRLDRPWRVLTVEQVRQIKAAAMPAHALAVRYGVGTSYIRQIRCGAERCTDLTRQTSDGNLCA